MTYLVTGVGHSGTTFYARFLQELGADFGPPGDWMEGKHAMELPAMAVAAQSVLEDLRGISQLPAQRPLSTQADAVARAALPLMPDWIKSPSIGYCLPQWIQAGLEVDYALVVMRPAADIARSISAVIKDRSYEDWLTRAYGLLGMIFAHLEDAGIKYDTVPFPPSSRPETFWDIDLPLLLEIGATAAAFEKVYRKEWVS